MALIETDRRCAFCGEAVTINWPPDRKKDLEEMVCRSPDNIMMPDKDGHRYHVVKATVSRMAGGQDRRHDR